VFVGSAKDELLTMVVDQKAATVEKFPTSGLFELTRDGVPIWVNAANVSTWSPSRRLTESRHASPGVGLEPLEEFGETTSETKRDGARLPREPSPAKVAKDG
jgi:hypothetical protein